MNQQVVAFRAFLVILVASILVTAGLWLNEEHELSYIDNARAQDYAAFKGYSDDCLKHVYEKMYKGKKGFTSACAQADRYEESLRRWDSARFQHDANARNYLLMLIFVPLTLVLCFYAGRWILTGRLGPFWLLHDD